MNPSQNFKKNSYCNVSTSLQKIDHNMDAHKDVYYQVKHRLYMSLQENSQSGTNAT